MKDLKFFDASCTIGGNMLDPGYDENALLREMDRSGVEKALVSHSGYAEFPQTANDLIVKMIKAAPDRLKGVWCLLPQQCPEIPAPEKLCDAMRENNIAALTLYPTEQRWYACRLTIGKYMEVAEEHGIPVFLDGFGSNWDQVYAFLREFPRNTAIYRAVWGKWGIDRQIRPLLENYENFYFALKGYWVPEGIRDLAGLYGAGRLLFASGFPLYNMGNQMFQLKHSGLSDGEIAMIAGGNLEKILKGAGL